MSVPYFPSLRSLALLPAALLCVMLASCGGGGGGSAASNSTTPSVTISVSPTGVYATQIATLTWSTTNATSCTASGAWSGTQATSGSVQVSQASIGSYTYGLSCTGSGGTGTGSTSLAVTGAVVNTVPVTVDNGPAAATGQINVPYVSVTICKPGTTVCQTIDHILVDTGSYGLRIAAEVMNPGLALNPVTTPSGLPAGECVQYASGYQWGSVQRADILMGGEVASNLPISVVGDTSTNFATVPSNCITTTGSNISSVAGLGANGILGIGLFKEDCGDVCVSSAVAATYYGCSNAGCTGVAMPLASQVSNPVASFAHDNNGVLLVFPAVGTGGTAQLTGSLIFGIGTQGDNVINSETVYRANSSGNFTTTYKSRALTSSYLDSGSNAYYFNDNSIRACTLSTGFFCPFSPVSLSAVNTSADGSASGTINFTVEAVDALGGSIIAGNIGGTISGFTGGSSGGTFDWGLPFFFGRRVFVALDGATTPNAIGPYWAY